MAKFRFMDFDIWKDAMRITNVLFDVADQLEKKKLYRFADQLRGAAMSVTNNIAEGSGSNSNREFSNFLNIARRSTFENANILLVLKLRKLVGDDQVDKLMDKLEVLCRRITAFQRSL